MLIDKVKVIRTNYNPCETHASPPGMLRRANVNIRPTDIVSFPGRNSSCASDPVSYRALVSSFLRVRHNRNPDSCHGAIHGRNVQGRKEAPLVPRRGLRPGITNLRFGVPDELKDLDVAFPHLGTLEGLLHGHRLDPLRFN